MKKILLIVLAFFAFAEGFSQTQLWSKTSEGKLNILEKTERASFPSEYQLYHLDFSALKSQLSAAPARFSRQSSNVIVSFPNAEGKLERFRIFESSVMEPELAIKHQEIQSYIGQGIDDSTASIYLTSTIFGFHGMVLSTKGTYYIDPYTKDVQNYIVYNKSKLTTNTQYICHVEDEAIDENILPQQTVLASDGLMRTYRMAMACTSQYSNYHIQAAISAGTLLSTASDEEKKDVVLAAMNVTIARLNTVYERDLSLRMVLVANNKNVIFLGRPEDPTMDNNNANNILLDQSKAAIDANIGFDNYDIGHTASTGGGGVAQSPSVCLTGKARGVTGLPSPVGDAYDIDFVAHEVGHQFSASHTFNGVGGNCTSPGTRASNYAVEPGSGTTIMAYAGICAPVNVQEHSDAYFHAVSMAQIVSHITGAGNCSVNVANGNTPPSIEVLPTSYTIPAGTPFVLKAAVTDADGDTLTYCWEQYNAGANTSSPTPTTTASIPNFRSFNPTTSPSRYFPAFSSVLNNTLSTTWEVIPTVARTMNFALTARDNKTPNGGQTARRNVGVIFDASGTPFKVTSQNTSGIAWLTGETKTITWNVGATNVAPISTENVNILLSTDGGQTFNTLVANTPNDGTQDITVPNVAASLNCRIMIEAVGNVYYALNANQFAIGYIITTNCETFVFNTPFTVPDGATAYTIKDINVPTSGTVTDVNLTANITHSNISDLNIVLLSPANTLISLINGSCAGTPTTSFNGTFDDQGSAIACGANITGNILPLQTLSAFNGQSRQGNWRVGIRDLVAANAGTVNSYTLTFCTQTVVLSTKTFGLTDFKIYPNPNNGNFSIQFNSDSGNEIKVNVHDISGRQILSKSYQNTGMFSENIQMNNIQKGIYIVTVLDGDVKETKKIVIQ